MKKKKILYVIAFLVLVYPAFTLFHAIEAIGPVEAPEAEAEILNYQVSVWITWIFLVAIAVYFKWTRKRNLFFFFTYGYLLIAFALFGTLSQMLVNAYDLPGPFEDSYTFGVLIAVQNILMAGVLTGFLQGATWWFTRRWHRR